MSDPWSLNAQLAADTHALAALPLCDVRLMDNALYPWLILVPRITGAIEWIDLDTRDSHRLADEIAVVSHALRRTYSPEKLNIATLGNVVSQLHVHVVARFRNDMAWPGPVWGGDFSQPYPPALLSTCIASLRDAILSP